MRKEAEGTSNISGEIAGSFHCMTVELQGIFSSEQTTTKRVERPVAGFREEVRGYLPGLAECLRRLGEVEGESEALGEMHRLVRRIREASGVLGLGQVAQLSGGLEAYVDDLAGGVMEWDEQTLGILAEAVEGIRMHLEGGPMVQPGPVEMSGEANPEMVSEFLIEAQEALELVAGKLRHVGNKAELLEIRRAVHTLKGAGAMVGLNVLSSMAHRMEDALEMLYEGGVEVDGALASLLKDSTDLLVRLVEAGGRDARLEAGIPALFARYRPEAVVAAPMVESVATESVESLQFVREVGELSRSLERLRRLEASFEEEHALVRSGVARDLHQTAVDLGAAVGRLRVLQDDFSGFLSLEKQLRSRMSTLEARLQRTVRMAAAQSGKRVELVVEGGAVELDKALIEEIRGPLEHLLRNAVVHGIEEPAERRRCGKAEVGRIVLEVVHEGAEVAIRLSDDGGGLRKARIVARAVEKGLVAGEGLDEEEIYGLLFMPGFSTAEGLTELAGRGMGLDVVKSSVENMKGSLHVESVEGRGTSFSLRLPVNPPISKMLTQDT